MTQGTMELIQTVTVSGATASNIVFSNIPATYNDLVIYVSARSNRGTTEDGLGVQLNNLTSGYTYTNLTGNGFSAASASTNFEQVWANRIPASNSTGNTFSNNYIYIPNYAGSTVKAYMADGVTENNATESYMVMQAISNSTTSAITSITLTSINASFVQHTTATLYGITRVPAGAKATGGVIYDDSSFFYHVFTSSGTFTPSQNITADCLVIAGGGGGSLGNQAGGGGAGGLLAHSAQSLISATSYTVTVGGGGAGGTSGTPIGSQGSNSVFGSLTASVGGGFGGRDVFGTIAGGNGGSGGGGGTNAYGGTATGGTATSGQGNNGGTGANCGAGGGGAGAVGANGGSTAGGAGGAGSSTYSSWGTATFTGQDVSGTRFYAGGGSGGSTTGAAVAGGNGGGGAGGTTNNDVGAVSGTANTGGGGGGGSSTNNTAARNGGSGGSGIVIVRYAK